jgi:hypothetical protein
MDDDPIISPLSSPTTNYGWAKPTVGGDNDAWGGMLNTDLDQIDSTVKSISTGLANRNKIINGDMRIDSRNAGASGTSNAAYTVDRWRMSGTQTGKLTWQQVANGPGMTGTGWPNSLQFTSSSAYAVIASDSFVFYQPIEAANFGESGWGSATGIPATLSFWAWGSIAGTYGGSIRNNGNARSYPFSYTLAASTWTYVTIPVQPDTSGTWLTSGNGVGAYVGFSLGTGSSLVAPAGVWAAGNFVSVSGAVSIVGTNGAQFLITGVQFEFNLQATPFERRSIGTELALCQRYYEKGYPQGSVPGAAGVAASSFVYMGGLTSAANFAGNAVSFKVVKRTTPGTLTLYSPNTGASGKIRDAVNNADVNGTAANIMDAGFVWFGTASAASTQIQLLCNWAADAEL